MNVLSTFSVGVAEVQRLDLARPRHGRHYCEGILAGYLLAVINVELQESTECLKVLEVPCEIKCACE